MKSQQFSEVIRVFLEREMRKFAEDEVSPEEGEKSESTASLKR